MLIEMEIERPEDVRLKLTCTMTVGQWQLIAQALDEAAFNQNRYDFYSAIKTAIGRAKIQVDNRNILKS